MTLAAYVLSGLATIIAAWITAHVSRLESRVSSCETRIAELERKPRKRGK